MGKVRKAKKMLLYVYPPNKKSMGYIVKCVKAVHLINNGSMLSTIRWELLEVPIDSLVGEEHYSQFKALFKTKFKEEG